MPKKGRKGVDQRVKGNAKSASSGRMVELMGGGAGAGVIGFEAVSSSLLQQQRGGGASATVMTPGNGSTNEASSLGAAGGGGGGEEVSHGSGSKFQVVMKQLGKKDTTTKLKALQEFATLCSEEPPEVISANLNVWVLMYNKLSMDNDNRVREASHKALKACTMAVKNSLAPHLRSIVGCWVSGIEDPYRPSASAALAAFNSTFSGAKRTEMLEFSFKTVVKHAGEIVLKRTPDTFSDPKIVSVDERVQRYERAVVMAVKSLGYIFLKLSDEFLDKELDVYEHLFSDKKFWKIVKHENPSIRAASYGVITTLCEQLPFFIKERPKLFCTTALGSLSESDPIVVGPLWEAALMVIGRVKSWNEHVSVQKALLPGLWSVMDSGGHGSAKVIYPCFLPLLSQLVDKVYRRDSKFAKSFLMHLRNGLQSDRVRSSPVECEAVVQAYAECYLFLTTALELSTEEQRAWYEEASAMLMELLEYCLTSCPVTQIEPIMAGLVRVVSGMIQSSRKYKVVEPLLSDFQLRIAEKCSQVLSMEEGDKKASGRFERVEKLIAYFHTPPKKGGDQKKKFVNFVSAAQGGSSSAGGGQNLLSASFGGFSSAATTRTAGSSSQQLLSSSFSSGLKPPASRTITQAPPPDEKTKQIRDFIKPSVCTLCGNSIAAVSREPDTNYSHFLLTLVQLYKDKDLVKSVFSSLDSNHHPVIVQQLGNHPLKRKLLIVCSLLTKAARLDQLGPETAEFTENILESLVLLLDDHLVDSSSAVMLLSEIVKDCPPVMPLLLVKLLENDRQQEFELLLDSCNSYMEELLSDMSPENSLYLWSFLHVLFTYQSTSSSSCEKLSGRAFCSICQLLTDSFNVSPGERNLTESSLKNLLSTLCKVQPSVIQGDQDEEASNLLGCLLHWCLHQLQQTDGDETYLSDVVECYSHLIHCLPDLRKYLQSVSHLVLEENRKGRTLAHTLYASVFYLLLHRSVMTSPETFWDLYEPLLTAAASIENSFLPLPGLESFCNGRLLFAPFFADLSSSVVSPSIPHSLLLTLFPAIPFAELKYIHDSLRAPLTGKSSAAATKSPIVVPLSPLTGKSSAAATNSPVVVQLSPKAVEGIIKAVTKSIKLAGPDLVGIAYGDMIVSGIGAEVVSHDHNAEQSLVVRNWKLLTTSLCLAHSSLQECQLMSRNQLEVQVRILLLSAIEKCLSSVLDKHNEWIDLLIKSLLERASSDGPVWLVVIQQVFSTLSRVMTDDNRAALTKRLVRPLLEDPQSGILYSALSCLDQSSYASQLETFMDSINDPCLLLSCLHLFPEREQLLSKGSKVLSEVASKQASSEIMLFESLAECSQDPFSFCVLGLIQFLVKKQAIPVDAWEFVLCSLITLMQLIADKEKPSSSINQTVLLSCIFSLCHSVALFFSSPFPQTQQATEWEEFFQPALQDCILPYFMKTTGVTQSLSLDSCLTCQHYSLCQAVSVLCQHPQNASFEELVGLVLSQFYPQQVTAFILAKRLLGTVAVYLSDPPSPPPKDKSPMKLSVIEEVLGKALERVNMDLVFLEDSEHSDLSVAMAGPADSPHLLYHNTTAYVFTWLLIIEAMSHCDPETRGALSEWMKELSLFDHLLHGLLKFLNESSKGPAELKVSLCPSMELLSSSAFMEIARHLPSMLRQWYLSVDRQTSATVNKFTTKHISPALQQLELQSFGKSVKVHGNMEVRVYSGVSEISVVYKVDEFSIELFVHLPTSYPLQPPAIREGKRIKIDPAQWRKWLLQFNIFVTNQNGSLMDGILLWKTNLDKHFAGVEDCMICFSVIHNSNYSLPKMVCRTCKKKFHNACLYKWFNTSTKSSCPLCRNIF